MHGLLAGLNFPRHFITAISYSVLQVCMYNVSFLHPIPQRLGLSSVSCAHALLSVRHVIHVLLLQWNLSIVVTVRGSHMSILILLVPVVLIQYKMTCFKVTGYSCARRAKCIGKCILKLANQESLVRTARAT